MQARVALTPAEVYSGQPSWQAVTLRGLMKLIAGSCDRESFPWESGRLTYPPAQSGETGRGCARNMSKQQYRMDLLPRVPLPKGEAKVNTPLRPNLSLLRENDGGNDS